MENSLITSLLAWGFAKLDRHSSRHCRSNDKTGVIPEPPANALALRWEVYVECRLDTPLWWFGICFQGKFFVVEIIQRFHGENTDFKPNGNFEKNQATQIVEALTTFPSTKKFPLPR